MTHHAKSPDPVCYRFGAFRLYTRAGLLYLRDESVALTPKASGVLLTLVERAGEVVTRQELIDRVWPDTIVEESSITKNISIVRKLLRDEFGDDPIRTVSRRGYQLTIPVVALDTAPAPSSLVAVGTPVPAPPPEPVAEPSALPADQQPQVEPLPRAKPAVWLRAALIVGVLAGISAVAWRFAEPGLAANRRLTVAVFEARNVSGDPKLNWISTGITETLRSELTVGGRLERIPGDLIANTRAGERSVGLDAVRDPASLARIREQLGCDLVVLGSFLTVGDRLRIDLELRNARTGDLLRQVTETGNPQNLFDLVADAGQTMRGALGVSRPEDSRLPAATRGTRFPAEALRQYSEALELSRSGNIQAAADLLARPELKGYAPAHAALSAAWSTLGFDVRARDEAAKALAAAEGLPQAERLAIEARHLETQGNWAKAAETWSALARFYPGDIEYRERAAAAQASGGRPKEALETLAAAKALNPSSARTARLALVEAEALEAGSDWKGAAAAADSATRIARANGFRLLESRALLRRGFASHRLGEPAKALADYAAAQQISTELHDDAGVATAVHNRGEVLLAQEDPSAETVLRQALEIDERIGYRRSAAHVLQQLALARRAQADMKGARAMLLRSIDVMREIGDGPGEVMARINLGNIALNTGDSSTGRRDYTGAWERALTISDRRGAAIASGNIALIDLVEGDVRAAISRLNDVLRLKREIGDRNSIAYTLGKLAEAHLLAGDLPSSRRFADEQTSVLKAINAWGPRHNITYSRLAIEEGHPQDAEPLMSALGAQSPKPSPGAEAFRVLTEARLARGDLKGAREAADQALSRAKMSANRADFGIPVDLVVARVDAAEGKTPAAIRRFDTLAVEAKKLNNVQLVLEARLGSASIRGSRPALDSVRADAFARGYGLIALKAARAGEAKQYAAQQSHPEVRKK